MELNEALDDIEKHIARIRSEWPEFEIGPNFFVGDDSDLDDFVDYANIDGKVKTEKTKITCFGANDPSFITVLVREGIEYVPWILAGFLLARKKVIEFTHKGELFRLENPDEATLKRVLRFVDKIKIKSKS